MKGKRQSRLDLTKQSVPRRFQLAVKFALKSLKFNYAVTKEEADILKRIRQCQSFADLRTVKTSLFAQDEVSDSVEYIRTSFASRVSTALATIMLLGSNAPR